MRARERLRAPEPGLAGSVADRAEDVEGDPAGGDPLPVPVQGPDPERQVIEQQRALRRPEGWAVRLESDRREELDPVGDELAHLAALGVDAKAPGAIAGDAGGLDVGGAGTDCSKGLRDSAGDELVVTGRLRSIAALDLAFAVIAGAVLGLLTGHHLGEDVRLCPPGR